MLTYETVQDMGLAQLHKELEAIAPYAVLAREQLTYIYYRLDDGTTVTVCEGLDAYGTIRTIESIERAGLRSYR